MYAPRLFPYNIFIHHYYYKIKYNYMTANNLTSKNIRKNIYFIQQVKTKQLVYIYLYSYYNLIINYQVFNNVTFNLYMAEYIICP